MRNLILLLMLSASCGKTGSKPDSKRPPQRSDDGTESTATALTWRTSAELPDSVRLPLKSASLSAGQTFMLKDSANQFFILKDDTLPLVPLTIPQDALNLIGSQNFELSSETSAWSLSGNELKWVRWGNSKKDLAITTVPLSSTFPPDETKAVKLMSVQDNSALLSGISKSVHVKLEANDRQLREFEGVVLNGLKASAFGHIFTVDKANTSVTRLLETDTPRWHKHAFESKNSPQQANFVHYEITGRPDAVNVIGIAAVGKKLWVSQPATLGSTTQSTTNAGVADKPLDQKLSNEAEALFVQYCAGCHEGRSPVFVKTSEGAKRINSQILLSEKDKVIRLMNLPSDDPKVMPTYGRPRPNAAELKLMTEL